MTLGRFGLCMCSVTIYAPEAFHAIEGDNQKQAIGCMQTLSKLISCLLYRRHCLDRAFFDLRRSLLQTPSQNRASNGIQQHPSGPYTFRSWKSLRMEIKQCPSTMSSTGKTTTTCFLYLVWTYHFLLLHITVKTLAPSPWQSGLAVRFPQRGLLS